MEAKPIYKDKPKERLSLRLGKSNSLLAKYFGNFLESGVGRYMIQIPKITVGKINLSIHGIP